MKLLRIKQLFGVALTAGVIFSCGPAAGVKEEKPLIVETPENAPVILEEKIEDNREMVDGFRVKVDSRATIEEAKILEKEIAEKIDEPIYSELIVDQYMVYVGDCQSKEDGEELKKKMRLMGFNKSYLVPKQVFKRVDGKVSVENISVEDKPAIDLSTEALSGMEKHLGYRVQVFAGKSKQNAEKFRRELAGLFKEKIYLVVTNELYKLQIGDYKSKPSADVARDAIRLANKDLEGAFTVESIIYKDKNSAINSTDKFYVQIGAFATNDGAQRILETAVSMGFKAIVLDEDGMFKVIVGDYPDKTAAEEAKSSLVSNGFEGAWILEK